MSMGTCRSCSARVVWAKKSDGKPHPLEAVDPYTGNARVVDGVIVFGAPGTGHYVSHFARCPDAAKWRPKRPEAR